MVPYNEKIWGVHPREITAAWCARFVPLPNLEQIIAGAVGAGPPEMGYNQTFLYPTRRRHRDVHAGAGRAPGRRARRDRRVARRDRLAPARGDGRRRRDPLQRAGGDPAAARAAEADARVAGGGRGARQAKLRCTTLRYLNIGTRSPPPADWHWIYVPEKRYPFYRVNVFSTAMPSMAPEGCASICVEMADRGPVSDATVTETIAALVGAGALAHADDVLFVDDKQIEYAYVVFDQHYYAATRTIFDFLEANGIHPRGRYGAWTYNAMEDCVLAGREVAALIDGAAA